MTPWPDPLSSWQTSWSPNDWTYDPSLRTIPWVHDQPKLWCEGSFARLGCFLLSICQSDQQSDKRNDWVILHWKHFQVSSTFATKSILKKPSERFPSTSVIYMQRADVPLAQLFHSEQARPNIQTVGIPGIASTYSWPWLTSSRTNLSLQEIKPGLWTCWLAGSKWWWTNAKEVEEWCCTFWFTQYCSKRASLILHFPACFRRGARSVLEEKLDRPLALPVLRGFSDAHSDQEFRTTYALLPLEIGSTDNYV